jgi:hypothetical protein
MMGRVENPAARSGSHAGLILNNQRFDAVAEASELPESFLAARIRFNLSHTT